MLKDRYLSTEWCDINISIFIKSGCSTFWKQALHISFELWQLCHAVVYLLHCRVAVQNLKRHVYAKVRAYSCGTSILGPAYTCKPASIDFHFHELTSMRYSTMISMLLSGFSKNSNITEQNTIAPQAKPKLRGLL